MKNKSENKEGKKAEEREQEIKKRKKRRVERKEREERGEAKMRRYGEKRDKNTGKGGIKKTWPGSKEKSEIERQTENKPEIKCSADELS